MVVTYQTNRPEMMECLRSGDLTGYMAESACFEETIREWAELAIAFANARGCIMVTNDYDELYPHWWYLHKCPLGCLQLTTWDELGPVGDIKIRKVDDLTEWARSYGTNRLQFETEAR